MLRAINNSLLLILSSLAPGFQASAQDNNKTLRPWQELCKDVLDPQSIEFYIGPRLETLHVSIYGKQLVSPKRILTISQTPQEIKAALENVLATEPEFVDWTMEDLNFHFSGNSLILKPANYSKPLSILQIGLIRSGVESARIH